MTTTTTTTSVVLRLLPRQIARPSARVDLEYVFFFFTHLDLLQNHLSARLFARRSRLRARERVLCFWRFAPGRGRRFALVDMSRHRFVLVIESAKLEIFVANSRVPDCKQRQAIVDE